MDLTETARADNPRPLTALRALPSDFGLACACTYEREEDETDGRRVRSPTLFPLPILGAVRRFGAGQA